VITVTDLTITITIYHYSRLRL